MSKKILMDDQVNPFLVRYRPNKVFKTNTYVAKYLTNKHIYQNSKTDKEAHRVTLASMRGALSSSNLPQTSGTYGFKAGTSLDMIRKYDDSFFRRPDLTLADIDSAIAHMKESLEGLDEENKIKIQEALANAENARKEAELKQQSSSNPNSSSATPAE